MDEAWIQQSLARLETLETQKAQLEASGQTANLAEIEAEIAALYEVLESVADEAEAEEAAVQRPAFAQPQQVMQPAAPTSASPFEQPAYAPPVSPDTPPPAMAPAPSISPPARSARELPGGYNDPAYADVDIEPPRSKAPILAVAALAIAGLGAGGWYIAGQQSREEPEREAPVGEPQVIDASAVPEDTQEPEVAKGADAQRTLGTKVKESNRRPARKGGNKRRRGGGSKPNTHTKRKKEEGRRVNTIDSSRDPLAGVK